MTYCLPTQELGSFANLTEKLQECIQTQDIEGAMAIARERHDALVSLFERSGIEQGEKIECAQAALNHLRSERLLAKSKTHQDRSNFIARKSAYRAYALKAA